MVVLRVLPQAILVRTLTTAGRSVVTILDPVARAHGCGAFAGRGSASHSVVRLSDGGLLMFGLSFTGRFVSVFSQVAEVAIFSAAAVALTVGMLSLR